LRIAIMVWCLFTKDSFFCLRFLVVDTEVSAPFGPAGGTGELSLSFFDEVSGV
jgi:hypothetical protein